MEAGSKWKHKGSGLEMTYAGHDREDGLIELHASEEGGWFSWVGSAEALAANFEAVAE